MMVGLFTLVSLLLLCMSTLWRWRKFELSNIQPHCPQATSLLPPAPALAPRPFL